MARVPVIVENTQQLRPVSRERFEPADFEAGGRAITQGMQRVGGAIGQYAEAQDQLDAALDNAGAKTLDNEFVTSAQSIRSGFLSQQGLNAGTARAASEQSLRDLSTSLSAKATTPRMRKMLEGVMGQRVAGMMGEFANHVTTQTTKAEDDASVARLSLAGEEAAATTDPVQRQHNIDTGLVEVASRGARLGWGADTIGAEQLKFTSGVHSSILQGMVTADNLDGAVAYYDQHADQMATPDKLRYAAMVRDPLERRTTLNDAASIMGTASVSGSQSVDTPVPTATGMFATITNIESRGRQFGTNGAPLRSSKGAVGVAQVMPATGPEAAKLAGLPWDQHRFENDAGYNAKLGSAYFAKQVETFGDPLKAAAAYNCGPGRCRDAIAAATAAGHPENWQAYLPAETRAYVKNFRAGVQSGVQQAPERHDLNALLARADVVGQEQGWSPERIDRVKREVERRVGVDESLLNRQEDDAQRQALDEVAALGGKKGGMGFTDYSQLSPKVRAALSPQSRLSFMSMAQENAKAAATGEKVKADGPEAFNLNMLAVYDPDGFKRIDLGMYQNKVTPGELETLAKTQATMRTAGPGGVDHGKIWGVINRGAPDLGLDLGSSKGKANNPDDRAASMRIATMMNADLNARVGGQRQPTDDEVQASYDRSVRQVIINGDRDHPVRAYQVAPGPASNVPDVDRQQIQAAFQRRYRRMPNEGEIARAYAAKPRR